MAVDIDRRRRTVSALMRLVAEFESNQPLTREGVALMVNAIKAFLRGDAADLPALLDLKPPSGRKDLAAHAIAAQLAGSAVRVVHADPPRNPMSPHSPVWRAAAPSDAREEMPPQ